MTPTIDERPNEPVIDPFTGDDVRLPARGSVAFYVVALANEIASFQSPDMRASILADVHHDLDNEVAERVANKGH